MTSYEAFTQLQKKYPRGLDNDYLMPAEIRRFIEYGKLNCIADESGLFAFIQREGFRKLVFRLNNCKAKLPSTDGSIISHLVYREGTPPKDARDWLVSQGFTRHAKLERYSAKSIDIGENLGHTSSATAGELYSFLLKTFIPEEMDLPTRDMFEAANTFCRRNAFGELIGAVYDMGHTRIVAISPEARGQGIGGQLYRTYMQKTMSGGRNPIFYEWIRPDNTASINMFKKLGFAKDNLVSDCYTRGVS